MPDLYSAVTNLDPAVDKQLSDAMELRATEPAQQAMLAAYLEDIRHARARRGRGRKAVRAITTAVMPWTGLM